MKEKGPWDERFTPLMVGGLAAAVGTTVFTLFPGTGEAFENAEYLALGAAVPALAAALSRGAFPKCSDRLRWLAVGLFLAFAFFYLSRVLKNFDWEALAGAALIAAWIRRSGERAVRTGIAAFLSALAGFSCALRLLWWGGGWRGLCVEKPLAPLLLLAFTVLGVPAFLSSRAARLKPGWWDGPALALFALGATRIALDAHDEAFLAGAIAAIRQGGWLLWDVPSAYGFLNIALASVMPGNPWHAVYLLNSALLFLSASAVYAALRAATFGRAGLIFSALAAFAAVLLVPGKAWLLDGPNSLPSVGAFRFGAVYALLAWAALIWKRRSRGEDIRARELLLGSILWALGCLWSCESGAYASGVAWPVFLMLALSFFRARRRKMAAMSILTPAGALAAAFIIIEAFYRLRLGHGPDWRCFAEYVSTYAGGYTALPIFPAGAVAALLWAGVLIVSLAAASPPSADAAWLIAPAFGAFWTSASYFVCRSHENNALNLAPVWLTALVCSLLAADRAKPAVQVVRAGALPLIIALMLAAYGRFAPLSRYAASLLASRDLGQLDRRIPLPNEEVLSLLARAGVGPRDSVACYWTQLLHLPDGTSRAPAIPGLWLAAAPAHQVSILPPDRVRLYARRSLARSTGGWILEPKLFDGPQAPPALTYELDRVVNPRAAGLFNEILVHHRLDASYESAHWRLLRFVSK